MNAGQQAFDLETYGEFRRVMRQGDFGAKVDLATIMAKGPSTGVGALADGRGEITISEGNLIVSYGDGAQADPLAQSAALLAVGLVKDWQATTVDVDVAPEDIEAFLTAAARSQGIDPDRSFLFEARGVIAPYVMHVNKAPTGGPYGHGRPMAITVESKGDEMKGRAVGVYVAPELVGIATHGGERTHSHWVSIDGRSTAHLDRWGLKAGARLWLPKPSYLVP